MARHWKIAIAILAGLAFVGALYFPSLLRNVLRLRRPALTEEQARREIVQQPISTPTDAPEKAQVYWASTTAIGAVEPVGIELPLSADPAERSKQLIAAIIARAPSPAQRTLPPDAELLQLYVLGDGTAVADFSEALPTQVPSGILSERMAVESIVHTLGANVPAVARLKILIHGQEAETLAGHLDLSNFFAVTAPLAPESDAAPPNSAGPPAPPIALRNAPAPASPTGSAVTPATTPAPTPAPALPAPSR